MNKARRKQLNELASALDKLRSELEDTIQGDLENVRDEERDYFDNMPESLQQGERGQAAEQAADALDNACDKIAEAVEALQEAFGNLEEAAQ